MKNALVTILIMSISLVLRLRLGIAHPLTPCDKSNAFAGQQALTWRSFRTQPMPYRPDCRDSVR